MAVGALFNPRRPHRPGLLRSVVPIPRQAVNGAGEKRRPRDAGRGRQRLPHAGRPLVPVHEAPVVAGNQDVLAAVPRGLQPHHLTALQHQLTETRQGAPRPQHLLALLHRHRLLPAEALQQHVLQAVLGTPHFVVDPVQEGPGGLQRVLDLHGEIGDVGAGADQAERYRVVAFFSVLCLRIPGKDNQAVINR